MKKRFFLQLYRRIIKILFTKCISKASLQLCNIKYKDEKINITIAHFCFFKTRNKIVFINNSNHKKKIFYLKKKEEFYFHLKRHLIIYSTKTTLILIRLTKYEIYIHPFIDDMQNLIALFILIYLTFENYSPL